MRKITFTILIKLKLNAGGKMKQLTESSSSQIFMNYSRTSIKRPLLGMRRLAPLNRGGHLIEVHLKTMLGVVELSVYQI